MSIATIAGSLPYYDRELRASRGMTYLDGCDERTIALPGARLFGVSRLFQEVRSHEHGDRRASHEVVLSAPGGPLALHH